MQHYRTEPPAASRQPAPNLSSNIKIRSGPNLVVRRWSQEWPVSAQSGRDLGHADLAGVAPEAALITQGYAGIVTYRSDTNGSSGGRDRIGHAYQFRS